MTVVNEHGSAELSALLSHLNEHRPSGSRRPSPTEAMALYFVAARLVELQLELADRGECDDDELAMTREVLRGTHRILNAALDDSVVSATSARPRPRPVLVDRRRPRGRYRQG